MKKSRLLFIFSVCICLSFQLEAQKTKNPRQENYWSAGISLNAFNYYGDLAPLPKRISSDIKFTRPNIGIEGSKKLGARFSLRGSFSYGRLRGDDFESADPNKRESIGRYGRNLHFRNDIFELAVVGIYEFLPSRGRFYRRRYVSPYLFAGLAGFYHNPKAKTPTDYTGPEGAGEWVALRPLSTEGQGLTRGFGDDAGSSYAKKYSLIQIAVPAGAGVKFRISDRLDLAFEMGFRFLFFDHIDDVGGNYADIRDLQSELAKTMFERSTEANAAVSGDPRDLSDAITGILGPARNAWGIFPGPPETDALVPEGNFTRLGEYGLRGSKRGNTPRENDLYVVTGFHLNYIFSTRRVPRYQSRP